MRNELDVNERRTAFREHERSNGARIRFPQSLQDDEILSAFPFLEDIRVATRRHPYAVIAAIVTAAVSVIGAIIGAVVFVAVAGFQMYGTQQATLTEIRQLRQENAVITSELKVMRTYNTSILSRQNFIAGLMSPDDQKRLNEFDRANPLYVPAPKPPDQ